MLTMNVIGCGNVGRTLTRLWNEKGIFKVGNILNSSLSSGLCAAEFIGSGMAIEHYEEMEAADVFLISTSDNTIDACVKRLANVNILKSGNIVFHCSGSLTSEVLSPAKLFHTLTASIHPIQSFADPATLVSKFQGTYCSTEGDQEAVNLLSDAFRNIGGQMVKIEAEKKMIYHAATVIACNYVTALLEVSQRCFEASGIARDVSLEMIKPILLGTIDNVLSIGTTKALTGPIARGDDTIIEKQLSCLNEYDEDMATLYAVLGKYALALSVEQGKASTEALHRISYLLDRQYRPY